MLSMPIVSYYEDIYRSIVNDYRSQFKDKEGINKFVSIEIPYPLEEQISDNEEKVITVDYKTLFKDYEDNPIAADEKLSVSFTKERSYSKHVKKSQLFR